MTTLGYNTNGFANHDPLQAIDVLHQIGFKGIGLTIDHHLLNPFSARRNEQFELIRDRLNRYQLTSVVESGARFLLDPQRKHFPTLLSASKKDRSRRSEFLRYCIDTAAALKSECVSLWSGTPEESGDSDDQLLERLTDELRPLLVYAESNDVVLAFEPEPGMFIDTMGAFDRLQQWVDSPRFRLTLDVGHLYCQGEVPIVNYVERYASQLANVHLEDMVAGVHEHLMFGDGEMYFPPIIESIVETQYRGAIYVELSRHSHCAPTAAKQAFDYLNPILEAAQLRAEQKRAAEQLDDSN